MLHTYNNCWRWRRRDLWVVAGRESPGGSQGLATVQAWVTRVGRTVVLTNLNTGGGLGMSRYQVVWL